MGLPAFFLAAALTVSPEGAQLREGCEPGERVLAQLAPGAGLQVRFAMGSCYAVTIEESGKAVQGFVSGDQISGLEQWEAQRRSAPAVSSLRDTRGPAPPAIAAAASAGHPLGRGAQLLLDNRPGEALTVAEQALVSAPRDAQLLALAGVAALRNDMTVRGIGFLKDSLAIREDPALRRILDQALAEQAADNSTRKLHSTRFLFRYDPKIMPDEAARALIAALEQEYSRISFELGCRSPERVAVIAQSREDYMRATGAAEWSGGQYDGRIRVALLGGDAASGETRRALAHEAVHACLAAAGTWPAWLHEGLAMWLSGERMPEEKRAQIRAAARANAIPRLGNLSQSWSRMSAGHAAMAYASALFAVELFYQHHKEFGMRTLIQNPDHLDRITQDLDRLMRE